MWAGQIEESIVRHHRKADAIQDRPMLVPIHNFCQHTIITAFSARLEWNRWVRVSFDDCDRDKSLSYRRGTVRRLKL